MEKAGILFIGGFEDNGCCSINRKDNKCLIARRSTGSQDVLGKWEFPGGKVEKDETEEHAIEREIKEEFEMDIKAIRFLTNNVCEYPSKTIDLRLYECKYLSGGTGKFTNMRESHVKD